jgi:protease-4
MKKFFKYVLATVVGVVLVNFVFTIIFFAVIAGMAGSFSTAPAAPEIRDRTVLELSLASPIVDRASENPLDSFDPFTLSADPPLGLNALLKKIRAAATDDRVAGIYLNLDDVSADYGALATIDELRAALSAFKEGGKFIYAYSALGYSQRAYYLAVVADSLFMNPEASLLLTGMSATVSYYKDLLEKVGVQPEVVRVGKFKSAVEPFLESRMSDANREQLSTYLNSRWRSMARGIAAGRDIPVERLDQLVNDFQIYTVEELAREKFIDAVAWDDQMERKLKAAAGVAEGDDLNLVALEDYSKFSLPDKNARDKKIAVIYAQGEIGMEQGAYAIGPGLAETIREAREDSTVKAIVLRVNSPGGSASTSDIIWREVVLAAGVKPVVASMGNVAASGGYYIACAANAIVAEPTTLTGSIGVFGLFFSGEKLIRERIGIRSEVVKTHEYSDFGGSYPLPMLPISSRGLSPHERGVLQSHVNRTYDTFLDRVSRGRGMTREAVHEVGQGRVWTGEDALRLGLVDTLGGLDDAIRLAAGKAGLTSYLLKELPAPVPFWQSLLKSFPATVKARVVKAELGEFYPVFEQQKRLLNARGVLARLPYELSL